MAIWYILHVFQSASHAGLGLTALSLATVSGVSNVTSGQENVRMDVITTALSTQCGVALLVK